MAQKRLQRSLKLNFGAEIRNSLYRAAQPQCPLS